MEVVGLFLLVFNNVTEMNLADFAMGGRVMLFPIFRGPMKRVIRMILLNSLPFFNHRIEHFISTVHPDMYVLSNNLIFAKVNNHRLRCKSFLGGENRCVFMNFLFFVKGFKIEESYVRLREQSFIFSELILGIFLRWFEGSVGGTTVGMILLINFSVFLKLRLALFLFFLSLFKLK